MFDADGHIFERDDEIFEHLDAPYKGARSLLRSSLFPALDNWNRTALAVAGTYAEGSTSKRGLEGTPELWGEMIARLDVEGTVLYPTAGMAMGIVKEKPWAIALARAYNNWMHHKYLEKNPRIRAVALIPTISPNDAAEEMRRVAKELPGMVGFFISANIQRPLGDAFYHPIFRTAEQLNMMVAVHAGGPGHRFDFFDRAIMARCLGHPTSLMNQMTHMMFSGVFDTFPKLRFGFMEAGVAWALFNMDRMEEAYEQWSYEAPEVKRSPAEHLRGGQIYFQCESDEHMLPYAVKEIGDTQLVYASDYPHIAPDEVVQRMEEFRARNDLSAESKQRILGDNAKRLYNLDRAVS